MRTMTVGSAQKKDTPHKVDVRVLSSNEHAQAVHITLQPGEALKKHITQVDVLFYVLEGTGTIEIGDETMDVQVDTLIESPARIPHRLMNNGKDTFRFLVVKTPRPTETTRVL